MASNGRVFDMTPIERAKYMSDREAALREALNNRQRQEKPTRATTRLRAQRDMKPKRSDDGGYVTKETHP